LLPNHEGLKAGISPFAFPTRRGAIGYLTLLAKGARTFTMLVGPRLESPTPGERSGEGGGELSGELTYKLSGDTRIGGGGDTRIPRVSISYLYARKKRGHAEIRTRVTRFKVWGPDHWTTRPKRMRGVGFEPTRISPSDLKPDTLTTRTSPLNAIRY
jgi:hypothetical protein